MTKVAPYTRVRRGKVEFVSGYTRKPKIVPVFTSNKSVTGSAYYDPSQKITHYAIVDTDPDRALTITQTQPYPVKKIEVEEMPKTVAIQLKGRKKKGSTLLIAETDLI